MSAETPTPKARKTKAVVEPATVVEPDAAVVADTAVVEDPTPADVPVVVADSKTETADAAGSTTGEVAPVATEAVPGDATTGSAYAGQQVVYVEAAVPPKVRSNRVVGVLLALLGAVVFAIVYSAVVALVLSLNISSAFVQVSITSFLGSAAFWVPVLIFTLAFVLLVLIVNRGGWAAHVFGSLLVALAVYFGTIGLLLLTSGLFPNESKGLTFASIAAQPTVIVAALVAREVSIWIGLAIAARGRRVKARNLETRTAWDKEQADKKAEIERAATPA